MHVEGAALSLCAIKSTSLIETLDSKLIACIGSLLISPLSSESYFSLVGLVLLLFSSSFT